MAQSTPRVGRKLAALLALFAMMFTLTSLTPAFAGSTVQLDSVKFTNEEVQDGSIQRIEVDWSVPGTAESSINFTVPLPKELQGQTDSFPIKAANGEEVGNCKVTETEVLCTLDDEFVDNNPVGLAGSFFFQVLVEVGNDETTQREFDFGSVKGAAPVTITPSDKCDEDCDFSGTVGWKELEEPVRVAEDGRDEMIFSVSIPAPKEGIDPGAEVVITDLDIPGKYDVVVDNEYPRLEEGKGYMIDKESAYQYPYYEWRAVGGKNEDGATWSADYSQVSFTASAGYGVGNNPTVEGDQVYGTKGTFYRVLWKVRAKTEGRTDDNGNRVHENQAEWTIAGEKSEPVQGEAIRYTSGGSAVGTNQGKLEIAKELEGDTTLKPSFEVKYVHTDPDGKVNEGTLTVKAGETVQSPQFIRGSKVTLTEVKPTEPSNVEWAEPVFYDEEGNQVTEVEFSAENENLGKLTKIRLVNKATLKKGEFSAKKTVNNAGNVPLPDGLSFTLNYEYPADAVKGFEAGSGTLNLSADGEAVTSDPLPVGAEVTLSEVNLPEIPGATWGEPVIDPQQITIGEGTEPIQVNVTNTVLPEVGSFNVTKQVTGGGAPLVPADATFTVRYKYDEINGFPAGSGELTLKAGETATVDNVPAGAQVTLTEATATNPEGATWGEPSFTNSEFTVEKDSTVEITLENPITWNDGRFSVTKKVTGDGAELVADDTEFTVEYTYTLPEQLNADPSTGTGTLTVTNNGEAVTSEPLPYGTEVTLSEVEPVKVAGGTWTGHTFDHPTFTIGDDTTFEVQLTNEIERDLGSFEITKTVEGTGADLIGDDAEFTVNYSYPAGEGYEAGEGTVTVTKGGTAKVDGLPAGAVVTLEEAPLTDPANGSWKAPNFPNGNQVTIGKNEVAQVSLVNTIEKNEEPPTPGTDDPTRSSGKKQRGDTPSSGSSSPRSSSSSRLARTGANSVNSILGLAGATLLAGATAVTVARRRLD